MASTRTRGELVGLVASAAESSHELAGLVLDGHGRAGTTDRASVALVEEDHSPTALEALVEDVRGPASPVERSDIVAVGAIGARGSIAKRFGRVSGRVPIW